MHDRLGTFEGALAPTLLTLLPVIPVLAVPWAVAQAGPVGAVIGVLLGATLAACSALAMAAVASDAPEGPAPAHAPLTRSLGTELGSTLSIPLLLARPATAALALIGARELWCGLWPSHPAVVVDGLMLVAVTLIAWRAPAALRVAQAPLLALLALALGLVLAGLWTTTSDPVAPLGAVGLTGPWTAVAVVFPALAGLLAGANLPGELAEPRRALPRGTLWSVAISTVLCLLLVLGAARAVPAGALLEPTALVARAPWPRLATGGLMLAALWAATAAIGGGARILAELARGGLLDERMDRGLDRPEAALPVVVGATGLLLLARDLPLSASLLTVVLLLCWGALNAVVLALTTLELPSFRPTLRLPRWVLVVGAAGSLAALLLVAPGLGLAGLGLLVARYLSMERRPRPADDRSGLLSALAEWAAARVQRTGATSPRAWRPHLLVPVGRRAPDDAERAFLVQAVHPEGSIRLLGLSPPGAELTAPLDALRQELVGAGIAAAATTVEAPDHAGGVVTALQTLRGTFLRPNLVYHRLGDARDDADTVRIVTAARAAEMGVLLLAPHAHDQGRRTVNVWLRPHAEGWSAEQAFALGHLDLALLVAIRLHRNAGVRINVVTAVADAADLPHAHGFLGDIATLGRLPMQATRTVALVGVLPDVLEKAPPADLHVLGLPPTLDPDFVRRFRDAAGVSVLMVADSGAESARA